MAVVFVGSTLLAQRREPLIGTVHDAAGKPVGNAEVTLVEDDAELEGLDAVDVCRATTDARGYFRVSALVGVRYSALACGPEVAGEALVAPIVTGASCGQICALQLEVPGKRRTIAMPLEPAWRAVAGLHVRMSWNGCAGHLVELPIGEQGIEVPPLAVVAEFSLRDGQGAFLGSVHVPFTGNPVADLPLPFRVAVRVVDEAGAPVVGARVAVQDRSTSSDLEGPPVLTDVQGEASLLWGGHRDPFDGESDTFFVAASHPGFAEGASGWLSGEPFVGFETKRHQARVLVVPLAKSRPVPRGAVDRAFAGQRARLSVVGNVSFRPGGSYFLPRQYDVVVAADGTYELPQLPRGATTVRLQLPPLDGRRIELLPTVAPTLPSAVLADCELVVCQVIDERGGPAIGAQVVLATGNARQLMPPITVHGRCRGPVRAVAAARPLDAAGDGPHRLGHARVRRGDAEAHRAPLHREAALSGARCRRRRSGSRGGVVRAG